MEIFLNKNNPHSKSNDNICHFEISYINLSQSLKYKVRHREKYWWSCTVFNVTIKYLSLNLLVRYNINFISNFVKLISLCVLSILTNMNYFTANRNYVDTK